jgi:nitrite reductase/ring-hydroxylating ferredoxin subunit
MKKLVTKVGKYLFIFILIIGINNACDEIESQIPDVPVSLNINLDILNELTIPGNSMYFPGYGFAGVIVYCELEGSYYAFDAACTYEINSSCKVVADGLTGTCSCCKSQYIFVGGYRSEGPASAPLKQYKTSLFGNTLRVYN